MTRHLSHAACLLNVGHDKAHASVHGNADVVRRVLHQIGRADSQAAVDGGPLVQRQGHGLDDERHVCQLFALCSGTSAIR